MTGFPDNFSATHQSPRANDVIFFQIQQSAQIFKQAIALISSDICREWVD